jgi:hypothetical protein
MLMGNVELRFPLLGILGIGKGYFGAWPLELYAFYDWGIAYAQNPGYWWGGFVDDGSGNPVPAPELVKPWFVSGGLRKPSRAMAWPEDELPAPSGVHYVYPLDSRTAAALQVSLSPGFSQPRPPGQRTPSGRQPPPTISAAVRAAHHAARAPSGTAAGTSTGSP